MITLKEALFSRKNLKSIELPYGLTKEDLKGAIKGFPMGVVVRMLEEQELQGNKPDVKVFQDSRMRNKAAGGFDWKETEMEDDFWSRVTMGSDFDLFFERYPDYERYNLS